MRFRIAARNSPLSIRQFEEFKQLFCQTYPQHSLQPHFLATHGDRDLKSSLIQMEKSDFFTKELDVLLLKGEVDMALHSAKDLPHPLPPGLVIGAITKGVDSRDALVLREGDTLEGLLPGSRIGVSTLRRIEAVKRLRSDLLFAEIRGTIERRLNQLYHRRYDGVVMAEAAIIRLGLHSLNRTHLEGPTPPLQGKLAVVIAKGENSLQEILTLLHNPPV